MISNLKKISAEALNRAEALKKEKTGDTHDETQQHFIRNKSSPLLHRGNSVQLRVSGDATYSEEEKNVLLTTSWINKHEFVPFMSIDLNER